MKKCPKCQSDWTKKGCANLGYCSLSLINSKEKIDWKEVRRKLRYNTPKDYYYAVKSFLKRRDLIRTGASKWSWSDKDHLMLHGMMGLLVDYVEKEDCFETINMNFNKLSNVLYHSEGTGVGDAVCQLYEDWKVRYPELIKEEERTLHNWAETTEMFSVPSDTEGFSEVKFRQKNGASKEASKIHFDAHGEAEKKRFEFEQDMLHRLIEVRPYLWT